MGLMKTLYTIKSEPKRPKESKFARLFKPKSRSRKRRMNPKILLKEYAANPQMVDASVNEDYIVILFTNRKERNQIGFDMVGPVVRSEIEAFNLAIANFLDKYAPIANYSIHSIHGRPLTSVLINPTVEDWKASAAGRVFDSRYQE